jgi:hypothetical protein
VGIVGIAAAAFLAGIFRLGLRSVGELVPMGRRRSEHAVVAR